ncbi:MAG: YedE family putative selenium transporter [Bacillota bacterium]|jgi:YedE family putative selenium metabolism protein
MEKGKIIIAGVVVGILALILVKYGNPPNMGFCIACFLRDIAGALGLHQAAKVQYLRPEIIGLVLGAFGAALATREFKTVGGSAALTRFALGFFAIIGFLIFLGCPLRMILRLAGGDLNAVLGLAGLVAGISAGVALINRGYSLGRTQRQSSIGGYIFPALMVVLLTFALLQPAFVLASKEGPGSMHAPLVLSLVAGLVVGILAQRSRLCMIGGIRDFILFRDHYLLTGFAAIFFTVLLGNLLIGSFSAGFTNQPIAHADGLWNFLGMALGGLASVLLGGCPLRQLVAAAEGNTDSAVTILGMLVGAAVAHNFGLAATPQGVPAAGQITVLAGLAAVFVIGLLSRPVARAKREAAAGLDTATR